MSKPIISQKSALQAIPSVDQLLRTTTAQRLRRVWGPQRLTSAARIVLEDVRAGLVSPQGATRATKETLLAAAAERLHLFFQKDSLTALSRVINATGVILHTNLGRAPLSEAARDAVARQASRYCTLEYDAAIGGRGRRGARVEQLLIQLTGAEDALIVNNCAAAALIILTVFARDGETIVSRGELVEIGGDFRVPDVMANSGTRMVEVGTTNKTSLNDYQQAINSESRLIMHVHQSNYRIVGFTSAPSLADLAALAHEAGLLVYEDAGSGVLADLSAYGLGDEPIIGKSLAEGADMVSFSGDKLLGGPQAGLIVGRHELINRLRKHSLFRALRLDKLSLAALEATLEAHLRGSALEDVPTLRLLAISAEEMSTRARDFVERLQVNIKDKQLRAEVINGQSAVGGGSGANVQLPTALVELKHPELSAETIAAKLRSFDPPVVARIVNDAVMLDLRTVFPDEESELIDAVTALSA